MRPRAFRELELELRARNDQESINFTGVFEHTGKYTGFPIAYGIKEIVPIGNKKQQSSDDLS